MTWKMVKIQSTVPTERRRLLHHCKVKKWLSWTIVSWGLTALGRTRACRGRECVSSLWMKWVKVCGQTSVNSCVPGIHL